jgi:Protein of unknown function (DUF1552)
MKMLDRRSMLGGLAAAGLLPFLEQRQARGATPPKRLVVFTNNEGTTLSQWKPAQTGSNFTLPPLLAPIDAFKSKINVLSGLTNRVHQIMGGSHSEACVTLMTANLRVIDKGLTPARGPSIEQVIAARIKGTAKLTSLDLRIGHGMDDGPMFHVSSNNPVGSEPDPRLAWNKLSALVPAAGGSTPPPLTAKERLRKNRKSVLDFVNRQIDRSKTKVGSDDRARLEAHAKRLAEMEANMAVLDMPSVSTPSAGCAKIDLKLPTGFSSNNETFHDSVGRAHCQNIAMALSCDMTRVATLQDVVTAPKFPWLNINVAPASDFHDLVHKRGEGSPNALFEGFKWNATLMNYLLQQMDSINEGNGTLLDNSLVLWINHFGDGGSHSPENLPIVLAGGLGKQIQTGRHLSYTGRSTSDLFVTLLQLFGGTDTSFGYGGSETTTGPLAL